MHIQSLGAIFIAGIVLAHPGQDVQKEALERRQSLEAMDRRSLKHCARQFEESGLAARNHARRAETVSKARAKRALDKKKRGLDDVLAKSHNMTHLGYTPDTDAETLFSGINSCVLTPEVTQGPYYVGGEDIRYNIIEEQPGIEILLDYQVIDVETCEPVPQVYLEMWHCNVTGVYSGVTGGNGDSNDLTNIDNTFLRGIQETTEDGVAEFLSVFPGHYSNRATHIHIMVHTNATVYSNGTLGNDVYASHVGQAFFDQNLIVEMDLYEPYLSASHNHVITPNADDGVLQEETATEGVDPLLEYTLLGDDVSDGLFMWLAFGIDTSKSQAINPATFRYKEGGVANPNSGMPGGGEPGEGGPGEGGPPGQTGSPTPTL